VDINQEITFKKRKLNDFAESKTEDSSAAENADSSQMFKPKNRNLRKKI
jgi:hypothetical protein